MWVLMRSQGWWLALLLGCSLTGAAHEAWISRCCTQLVVDQIRLARSVGIAMVCAENLVATMCCWEILPAQRHRPGLNHAGKTQFVGV